jgi:hypothetical protein
MGALRDRMIEEMKLRNFSAATQKTYLYAVTRLAKYCSILRQIRSILRARRAYFR